jgi:hydroxylysine kinase
MSIEKDEVRASAVEASGEDALSAAYIRMDDPEARALAMPLYGVEAEARRLDTEKDDTFLLRERDGRRLIMKVANPAEPKAEIDCQDALLQHLDRRDPTLPIPAGIVTRDGLMSVAVTDDAGQRRRVRLLTFIEGIPLDRAPSSPALRTDLGGVLARLRLAMADFEHPGPDRSLAWDVRRLLDLAPYLEFIADRDRRARLELGLERFAAIEPAVRGLRRQVLHNDFSRSNLIVDEADPDRLAGVIDFGDAAHTAIAIDVSTALLNQLPRELDDDLEADMFAAGRDLLGGYLERADLTQEELTLLPDIMRNTDQGWAQLEWFLTRSPAQVSATFEESSKGGSQ